MNTAPETPAVEPSIPATTSPITAPQEGAVPASFSLILPSLYFRLLLLLTFVTGIGPLILGGIMVFTRSDYAPFVNLYLIFYALALLMATNAWLFLVTCFDGVIPAGLYLMVPGYQPYFVWTRWQKSRQPFWLMLIGALCLAAAYVFTQYLP